MSRWNGRDVWWIVWKGKLIAQFSIRAKKNHSQVLTLHPCKLMFHWIKCQSMNERINEWGWPYISSGRDANHNRWRMTLNGTQWSLFGEQINNLSSEHHQSFNRSNNIIIRWPLKIHEGQFQHSKHCRTCFYMAHNLMSTIPECPSEQYPQISHWFFT